MPAYHSALNEQADSYRQVGNLAMLPIRTSIRGPAPQPESAQDADIIDEALNLFRANCLFRNYEIHGAADRVLVYLILFISDCLTRIQAKANVWTVNEATKQLQSHAVDNFALPGEPGFPINEMYNRPANRMDQDSMRSYLTQARQETVTRLLDRVYENGKPSKWWMAFTKRRFMNKSLTS